MDRRAFLALLVTSPVFATSFEEFKKQGAAEFKSYQDELLSEFDEYVNMINKEFSEYKRTLSKAWDQPKISSNHSWVQYSKDLKTRSIVDFKENFLKIESVGGNGLNKGEYIRKHLNHILLQDTKSAVKNDQLLMNIEERLSDFKHVKKGRIPKSDSILGLAFAEEKVNADGKNDSGLSRKRLNANEGLVYQSFPGDQQITSKSGENILSNAKKGSEVQKVNGISSDHVIIKLPSKFLKRRATKQLPIVIENSSKYSVNFAALMSLMHTESSFNPMALSESAYGLLMINPETSGKLAHKKIYGVEKIISPSFLYNNIHNIELGSAYFNLLYHQYLLGITNPVSRLYCAIVSYNAGLGSIGRAFTGRPALKKSFDKINSKDPDAVFKTFQDKLPFEESKIYLTKVKERLPYYIRQK